MELVPLPRRGGGQRRLQTRKQRRTDQSFSEPLLANELPTSGLDTSDWARRTRRTQSVLGDTQAPLPLTTHSNYRPPQPVGVDARLKQDHLDDYLYFTGPEPPSRAIRRQQLQRLNHKNPAVDLGGFFSHGCCCMQCVRTQEIGITENFGQFQEILAPGFYCMAWPLSDIAGRMSLRIQQLDVVCETKTKDDGELCATDRCSSFSACIRAKQCAVCLLSNQSLCMSKCLFNFGCSLRMHTTRFIA